MEKLTYIFKLILKFKKKCTLVLKIFLNGPGSVLPMEQFL